MHQRNAGLFAAIIVLLATVIVALRHPVAAQTPAQPPAVQSPVIQPPAVTVQPPVIMTKSGFAVEEVKVGSSCVVVVSGRGTNVAVAPCGR